jgi:beta-1,4-mannosyl-glycoprotein beta-1,4-N-acetylglucosaminyltransferase
MRKLVDCFAFNNELNMLSFRLQELRDVVDLFVIVEATYTFSGKRKELFFENNKDMYEEFADKIIHIVVEDTPNNGNAWDNDHFQKNCIDRGIKKINLNNDDLIMISDCDEIPDADTLGDIKAKGLDEISSLEMELYYYHLTCKGTQKWNPARLLPYSLYKTAKSPQAIRELKCENTIPRAGWHFSFFGDVGFIKTKIKSYAHQEYNRPKYITATKIQKHIEGCTDLFHRQKTGLRKVEIKDNDYLPKNYKLLL